MWRNKWSQPDRNWNWHVRSTDLVIVKFRGNYMIGLSNIEKWVSCIIPFLYYFILTFNCFCLCFLICHFDSRSWATSTPVCAKNLPKMARKWRNIIPRRFCPTQPPETRDISDAVFPGSMAQQRWISNNTFTSQVGYLFEKSLIFLRIEIRPNIHEFSFF